MPAGYAPQDSLRYILQLLPEEETEHICLLPGSADALEELLRHAVALANSGGGQVYLGLDRERRPTRPDAGCLSPDACDRVEEKILRSTMPPLRVQAALVHMPYEILCVRVPASPVPVATTGGACYRRLRGTDGHFLLYPLLPSSPSPSSFPGARQADLDGACRTLLRTSLSKRLMRDARLRLQDSDFDAALGLALPAPTLEGLLLIGRPGRLGHLLSEPAVTIRVREAQAARGQRTPLPVLTALPKVMDEVACLTRGDPSSPAFFDLGAVRSAIAWTLQCRDYTVHRLLQVQIARDLITVSAPLARDIQAPLLDGYLALLDPSLLCPLWLRLNEKALLLGGELPRVEEIDGEIRTIIPVCRPSEEWQAIASRLREELGPREDRRQLAACLLVLRVMSALRKSSFESLQGTVPLSAEELADALRTLLRLELLVECQSGIIFRAPQDPIFLQNPRLLLAMDLLEERGYLTRDGLAGHLQLPQHMAYALLRRLTDEGYLRMEHTGRAVQYLPSHRNIRFLIPDAEKNTPETTT